MADIMTDLYTAALAIQREVESTRRRLGLDAPPDSRLDMRVPSSVLVDLGTMARQLHVTRASLIRQILTEAIQAYQSSGARKIG
jgi:hypothetical protein